MRTIYGEIYRDLLTKIEQGVYPYQSLIPSEATLTKEYACSHNTLRKDRPFEPTGSAAASAWQGSSRYLSETAARLV